MRKIVEERSKTISDINEHLVEIYDETIKMKPRIILELGVSNTFNSTVALVEVGKDVGAEVISIDIGDCREALGTINYNKWHFYKTDDTNEEIMSQILKDKKVDVLFIDTSHGYEHTLKELEIYNKYLNKKYLIILHDTNSSNTASRVQEALEVYYKTGTLNWQKDFEIETLEGIKLVNKGKNNGLVYIYSPLGLEQKGRAD